ncbi:hypothetical protein [Cyanobium sp. ULC084]|nr:MAG: hypothetical protein DCF24_01230 [Cyanobium sp.]
MAAGLPSKAETLYTLDTFCSLQGKDAKPCIVTAVDVGDTTEYRHRIGAKEVIFRIIDEPFTRLELWDPAGKSWQTARLASVIFSLNAFCLNGTAFCVVNPNYLNSVREDLGRAVNGRDVLEVSFSKSGRVNASCYDDGCPDQGKFWAERAE